MLCVATVTAKTAASSPDSDWVRYSIRFRSIRSANTPPIGPNRNIGRNLAALVRPSWVPLWVRSSTKKDCATLCIQVPATETSWPKKNSR